MEEDRKSLLLVKFFNNGKKERALIDTMAMNNFMIKEEAERLGLKVEEDSSCTIKLPKSVVMRSYYYYYYDELANPPTVDHW